MSRKPTLYEIAQGKSRVNPVDDIEAEINQEDRELAREARRLRLQEIVERRKQKLQKLKGTEVSNKQIAKVGNQFLNGIMQIAQVDPKRAKEFMDSLNQDDIAKISMLSASGQGGGANIQALLPFIKSKDTNIKDIISIVKMVQPPQQQLAKPWTVADVSQIMKMAQDNRGSPEANPYPGLLNRALDEVKGYRSMVEKQNQQRLEKEIAELKTRPNFAQEMANKKTEFETFKDTFGGGAAPNIEVEKMKIDQTRWMFEQNYNQRKDLAEMQNKRASEKEKLKLIEKIAVPAIKKLGPLLDGAINAGKRKMSDVGGKPQSNQPQTMAFICPTCKEKGVETVIDVTNEPEIAVCKTCKTEFPKNG